jgi:predicted phage terminase large subunit-like protein
MDTKDKFERERRENAIDAIKDQDKLVAAATARIIQTIKTAREDPCAFIEFVMRDPQGNALKLKEWQKEVINSFKTNSKTIVQASRAHGKSTLMIGFLLWCIGNDPNIRIKLFCQNDKRAKERLFEIKSNIENNQAFKLVFPDIKPMQKAEWSKSAIIVARTADLKDATVEALGIETSATGGRASVIVLDDCCDLRSSCVYPTLRDKIITKFMGELLPMLDPGGKVIAIATPWHQQDLTAVLAKNTEFKSLIFRVGNDKDPYEPLWPERWPREELMHIRATQGPMEFDRAYRCVAYSSEMVPCKPEWIKFYNKELLGDPHKLICVQAYDLAIGEKENADYFAGVTILYDQTRNIAFVADAFHAHLSFSAQAQKIVDQYIRWNPDRVIIERVGLGGGLENFLREKSPITLPIVAYKPRGDKQRRFMEASPWLEDGHVYFHPNLDPQRNVLLDESGDLISELLEFPIGRHDDYCDAWVEAIWGLEEFKLTTMDEGWLDGGSLRARMTTVG